MTWVAGIDYNTRCADIALVSDDHHTRFLRFDWSGRGDQFDRSRSIRDRMPPRSWWEDEGVIAIGIENPAGHHAVRDLARVQGAILACLPTGLLVSPWAPAQWRKQVGVAGNAAKPVVLGWASRRLVLEVGYEGPVLTQDMADAYAIAHATQMVIQRTPTATPGAQQ